MTSDGGKGQDADTIAAAADPWTAAMRRGAFAEAWQISDRILESRKGQVCYQLPRHLQWVWDGRPLAGQRVLVRCYHGLGDTIQFVRFLPQLRAVAAEVIVWAQPALMTLLAPVGGIDRLLPLHDGVPDCAYDVDVEIMELPHIFRITLDTLPAAVPYLHADPVPRQAPTRPAVAVFSKSGNWDTRRDIPSSLLAPLSGLTGYTFMTTVRAGAPTGNWQGDQVVPVGEDLTDTAAVMTAADLVITVDSMSAHLAGALGVPTWTLLHADADWRWMDGREDTPWYPTMRLFRQPHPGDWRTVVNRVVAALHDQANASAGVRPPTSLSAGR